MLRRKIYASASLIFAAAVLLFAGTSPALAATTSNSSSIGAGNGMRISPVRTDLTVNAGSSQTIDVYVTNLTSQPADLQGVVDDFTAGTDESGTPYILLNGERAPSHSLKEYVTSIGSFVLAPQSTKDVKVTISMPSGVAGGGYFGAVRFLPANTAANNKNVNIAASVASLILVTVPGPVSEQMGISSFDVRRMNTTTSALSGPSTLFTSNKNLNAVVRFNNTGNLQEAPFGKILLKKGNNIVATYDVNNTTPAGEVLPSSIRRFSVPLTGLSNFGKYTLEGNFGYGSKGQLLSATTNFYIVPVSAIVIAAVVILVIIAGIFFLRSYIQGAVRKGISRNSKK